MKLNTKYLLLIIYFFFLNFASFSQTENPKNTIPEKAALWSFGVNTFAAGIIGYNEYVPGFWFPNAYAITIYASLQTFGKREWEQIYNFPRINFIASYYNFGTQRELGTAYGLTANFDYTLAKKGKTGFYGSAGIGFAYSEKVFDFFENPVNTAVSNPVSFSPRFGFRLEQQLSAKWSGNAYFNFTHFSNGSFVMPNDGLNFFLFGLGLKYQPNISEINYQSKKGFDFNKKWKFSFAISGGMKEVIVAEKTKHSVFTAAFTSSKQVSRFNSVLLGVDFFYNNSIPKEFVANTLPQPTEIKKQQVGITTGTELHIGKFSFLAQAGLYVYQPHKFYPRFYQRYGIRYYFGKFFINTTVKANGTKPDFVEYGIGFRI